MSTKIPDITKSIAIGYDDFPEVREDISEELTKIGDLADYIIEGGESMSGYDDFNILENLYYEKSRLEPIRTEPKVGRNDPCTCGSGKKYKKCCGKG